jgi:hypothetical protein
MRMRGRIIGPKRREVAGDERKLLNEELHSSYSSPDIIGMVKSRRMKWLGHVVRMVEESSAYSEKLKERPLGIHRHRWKDNIKTDLKEMEVSV